MMSRTTYTSAPSVQVGKLKQNRLAVSPRQRRKSFRSGEAKSELGRCCWNLQPKEILIPSAKRLFQQHRSKREAAFFWIMSASAGSGHSGRQANVSEVPCMDGARGAREKNLACPRNVRVQPCIRPLAPASLVTLLKPVRFPHRGLLRARRQRPYRHATEQRDELAPLH